MGMSYDEALQEWGARQLEDNGSLTIDRSTVSVDLGYQEGYGGCDTCGYGGRDGFSVININGRTKMNNVYQWTQIEEANMLDVFKGLMEVSGGVVTDAV